MEVFKIQRPLFDNEANYLQIMLYNKDCSTQVQVQVTQEQLHEIFPNNEFKVYRLAEIDENNQLFLGSEVNDPGW